LVTAGEAIEYRCLIRATNGKKTISTTVCIFEFVVFTMFLIKSLLLFLIKTLLLDELLLYYTRLLSEIQTSGYIGIKFWVLLTSALRALFKDSIEGNFVLEIQVVTLGSAIITHSFDINLPHLVL